MAQTGARVGRGLVAIYRSKPEREAEDIGEALSYAAWRAKEVEIALNSGDTRRRPTCDRSSADTQQRLTLRPPATPTS